MIREEKTLEISYVIELIFFFNFISLVTLQHLYYRHVMSEFCLFWIIACNISRERDRGRELFVLIACRDESVMKWALNWPVRISENGRILMRFKCSPRSLRVSSNERNLISPCLKWDDLHFAEEEGAGGEGGTSTGPIVENLPSFEKKSIPQGRLLALMFQAEGLWTSCSLLAQSIRKKKLLAAWLIVC